MAKEKPPLSQEQLSEASFIDLNTAAFDELFNEAPLFSKIVQVYARQIQEDEDPGHITTILLGGVQELNRPHPDAQPGNWIVVNPTGERFVVSQAKFAMRYEPIDAEIGLYRGIGLNRMIKNTTGGPVKIRPPWDPDDVMVGDEDCWFSMVVDPEQPDELTDDRYIIGNLEKRLTFAEAGIGYHEIDLLKEEITEYLRQNGRILRKTGYVFARKMEEDEIVKTIREVPDLGALILPLRSHPNKTLITPARGERYLIPDEAMSRRHKVIDERHGLYQAIGAIIAAPNPYPQTAIKARAPWGQMQHVSNSGHVVAAIDDAEQFDDAEIPLDRYLLDTTDLINYV